MDINKNSNKIPRNLEKAYFALTAYVWDGFSEVRIPYPFASSVSIHSTELFQTGQQGGEHFWGKNTPDTVTLSSWGTETIRKVLFWTSQKFAVLNPPSAHDSVHRTHGKRLFPILKIGTAKQNTLTLISNRHVGRNQVSYFIGQFIQGMVPSEN